MRHIKGAPRPGTKPPRLSRAARAAIWRNRYRIAADIERRLARLMQSVEAQRLLHGSGAPPRFLGTLQVPGIQLREDAQDE